MWSAQSKTLTCEVVLLADDAIPDAPDHNMAGVIDLHLEWATRDGLVGKVYVHTVVTWEWKQEQDEDWGSLNSHSASLHPKPWG